MAITKPTPNRAPVLPEPQAPPVPPDDDRQARHLNSPLLLTMLLLLALLMQGPIRGLLAAPVMQSWMTVFVAVVVQALPFLVLGVMLSAAIAVFVPASFFARALPKRPALAVPVAGAAGAVLPGCECASVPVAGALVRRGVAPAAALAFLLSAPAINPIVLTATAVAFPNNPEMVLARFVASLLVACAMGWLWLRLGRTDWLRPPSRASYDGQGRGAAFWGSVRHDVMHAGGFLVVGAMAAATLKAVVPEEWLRAAAGNPLVSVLALAVLAVLLSICSEADAFVAASLSQFSLTARLAFLVVGPMIDLKLFAMQAGTFGRGFALRFAPATFVLAVLVSVLTGAVLL
ncbi:permease [Streptomyces sp. NPDC001536]|uniref:permease n=1 Tax=Streptomyces sp. NPDC001536 TaxID=3364583 RepID=UPI0036936D04